MNRATTRFLCFRLANIRSPAEAAGFKTSTITGLTLQVNQEARIDIKLTVGSAAESIQVEATSPVLVTDDSSVGQVIENVSIANMPLNGRAFWQLAQLTPGAVYTPGGSDISFRRLRGSAPRASACASAEAAGWRRAGCSMVSTLRNMSWAPPPLPLPPTPSTSSKCWPAA